MLGARARRNVFLPDRIRTSVSASQDMKFNQIIFLVNPLVSVNIVIFERVVIFGSGRLNFAFCFCADNSTPQIIFSNRNELRSIDLRTFSVRSLTTALKNTVALDFYYFNNSYTLFWTDVLDDKIFKGTLDDNGEILDIILLISTKEESSNPRCL